MILGPNGSAFDVAAVTPDPDERGPGIEIEAIEGNGVSVCIVIDENHAQALVLALQSAIAEVQARAVQR